MKTEKKPTEATKKEPKKARTADELADAVVKACKAWGNKPPPKVW